MKIGGDDIPLWAVIGTIAVLLTFIFALMWLTRLWSNATTPITVHEVMPGVKCATMVTSDGVAIDCWKIYE